MESLPVFLKLAGRRCLVVGIDPAALAKIQLLIRAGADVVVATDWLPESLAARQNDGDLTVISLRKAERALDGAVLTIVGKVPEEITSRLSLKAKQSDFPFVVLDRPSLSNLSMGAIVDRSPIMVAIGTDGAAPLLARFVRHAIERLLPSRLGQLAGFIAEWREKSRAALTDALSRKRFLERLMTGPAAEQVLAGKRNAAATLAQAQLDSLDSPRSAGIVHLVGAGPGDPDLLTLRAHDLLSRADMVVYDRLVTPQILDLARRDAEFVAVGKAKGCHSSTQEEINQILLDGAAAGKRVVRLKSGDPFIFGRGGEELAFLRERGITVDVVPGISSALACAATAQIPLTHRLLAENVTFVSGHGRSGRPELNWSHLAGLDGTLVFFMAVSVAHEISRHLIDYGKAADTPIAIVENGSHGTERTVRGILADLPATMTQADITGPAIIIVGAVAAFSLPG